MHQKIIDKLYSAYKENGYVSEDSVFDALDENDLPLDEINILCNTLLSMGVIIKSHDDDEESVYDRSRTDYEQLYNEMVAIDYSLAPFIDKIKEIRPPQRLEWQTLLPSAQKGNLYSRDRIISMYLRLVVKIAVWHYKKYGISLFDAVQDGCIGLVVALKKYESARHNNFSQHASLWIRQHIMREADPANSLIYYPAYYKDRLFSAYEIYSGHDCEICGSWLVCPNLLNEIADVLCCSYHEAKELLTHLIPMDSVDEILDTDADFFTDRGEFAVQMIENFNRKEVCSIVNNTLKSLKKREEEVLRLRCGFYDDEVKTLENIGKMYNLTRERIRQIESKAIKRLRHPSRSRELKEFFD